MDAHPSVLVVEPVSLVALYRFPVPDGLVTAMAVVSTDGTDRIAVGYQDGRICILQRMD